MIRGYKTAYQTESGGIYYYFNNAEDLADFLICCRSHGARPRTCADKYKSVGATSVKEKSKGVEL